MEKKIHTIVGKYGWLIPILSIPVFFAVTAIHFLLFAIDENKTELRNPIAVRSEIWKLIWIGGSMTFCITAIWSVVHSLYVLSRLKLTKIAVLLLMIGVIVWMALGLSLWFQSGTGFAFGMIGGYAQNVLSGLLQNDIGRNASIVLVGSSTLGLGAMVFIVASACGLIHPRGHEGIEGLVERVHLLFHMMYLSSALALAAVFMIFGVFHWSATLLDYEETLTKNASLIADIAAFGAGVFYSLILVMTFVPPAIALQGMIGSEYRHFIREGLHNVNGDGH